MSIDTGLLGANPVGLQLDLPLISRAGRCDAVVPCAVDDRGARNRSTHIYTPSNIRHFGSGKDFVCLKSGSDR